MQHHDDIERVDWDTFLDRFRWQQGEHVSLIGHTNSGKTTLAIAILHRRKYVMAIGTKPADPTLQRLIREEGYKRLLEWPEYLPLDLYQKYVLWPKFVKPSDVKKQQLVIAKGIAEMFVQRGWAIFADEMSYLTRTLKLGPLMTTVWQQGRSIGLSLISGTQRPAWVPLEMYSQATHLFLWQENDRYNLKRMADIGGADSILIARHVARLRNHETLYVNTRTGQLYITEVNLAK